MCLCPVHTSNNVEATGNIVESTFDFVEATLDFVATNGNNVERFYCKIVECCFDIVAVFGKNVAGFGNNVAGFGINVEQNFVLSTKSKKIEQVHFFRHCRKNEISFYIVAKTGNIVAENGNNVEATFDTVERTVQLVAFDTVASTLLLVWTGLKVSSFRQNRNKLNVFNLFRLCRKDKISFDIVAKTATLLPKTATMSKQHSTLSKESSACSIRQCCWDFVAGMDGALRNYGGRLAYSRVVRTVEVTP